jgi:hypothetical protein
METLRKFSTNNNKRTRCDSTNVQSTSKEHSGDDKERQVVHVWRNYALRRVGLDSEGRHKYQKQRRHYDNIVRARR